MSHYVIDDDDDELLILPSGRNQHAWHVVLGVALKAFCMPGKS
ncbi:mCG147751 [Mus musculus]|nr:mCG147751 [Mus musculus]